MATNPQSEAQRAVTFATQIVRSLRKQYLTYLVLAALFAAISLLPAQLFHFFSRNLGSLSEANVGSFLRELFLFGGIVAVSGALAMFGRIWVKEWLLLHLEVFLRERVIGQLHALPLESIEGTQRGDWLTKASSDVRTTEDFLGTTVPELIYSMAILVGTAVILLASSGAIALLPILAAFLIAYVNIRMQKALLPLMSEMRGLHSGLLQVLLENLEGWKTIRSYGVSPIERERVDRKLSTFWEKGIAAARLIGATMSSNDFATQGLICFCLGVLAWSVAGKTVTVNEALLYPFYLGQFFFSVKGLVMAANGWNRYVANGGRLAEWLMMEPETKPQESEATPVIVASRVSIEDLAVKVPGTDKRLLVDDLDLELVSGEIRGLVGPSGVGKSTVLEVLSGLRKPVRGQFRLDNHPCQDMGDLSRSLCAYVAQKPYIFEGTLEANLTLGSRSFSDEEIRVSLEMAGISKVFDQRGGLSTWLHDRGENLSEGQRYRISIARALLLKRPFLLLDEPFAALDEKATDALVVTLNRIKAQKGIFLVTHYVPKSLTFDKVYSLFPTETSLPRAKERGVKDGRAPRLISTSVT